VSSGVTLRAFVVSSFALDGGAMHGIVPRLLWERVHTPDDHHRIPLVARAVLVDHAPSGSRTLIELGMGQCWGPKERHIYALAPGPDVPEILRAAGVDPDTVTHVVLTHLHWDHAGGLVLQGGGALAFPRAEHVVGDACLAHATRPGEKDRGSFRPDDIALLLREGRVRRWREGEPLAPGVEGRLSVGHTEGLVIPLIRARDDGPPVAVPTDLIPTRSHLKPGWVTAYDNLPAIAVVEKRALLSDLAAIGGGVALYHDPLVEAAWTVAGKAGPELVRGHLDGSFGDNVGRP
jgi:glyoxylase-like metal-dependent hydrolase (beta-lactamase superfamily II)